MNDSYFFTAAPQQPFYVGLPPTPSYSDLSAGDKLPQDLDPAYLPYDAPGTAAAAPPLQHLNSVDSGVGDLSEQHHHNHNHNHNHSTHYTQQHTQHYANTTIHPPLSPTPTHQPSHSHSHSSSEDAPGPAPLTPAQSRRKAQNRAAQRAFRDRKERHVRDLEAKLAALESASHALQSDNERLKLLLQRAKTENELLSATRTGYVGGGGAGAVEDGEGEGEGEGDEWGEVYTAGGLEGGVAGRGARGRAGTGENSLTASATWDLIQKHPLVAAGMVDVADVCERLRGKARCDGHGPVFEESVVWRTIEESGKGGGDELI